MNKKIVASLAIVAIAIAAAYGVYSMTWTSARISMTAGSASLYTIGLFQDCMTTNPFTAHDWDGVVQGQEYEVTLYVKNTGTVALYVTYLPTDLSFDLDQTRFTITVNVIEGPATPCQLNPITPVLMPEKNPLVCNNGFLLNPGKVIKIDIVLTVASLVSGGHWAWDFDIFGCAP
jgi:archaellum component FlaG (FlaF/FlaG flagellin family)